MAVFAVIPNILVLSKSSDMSYKFIGGDHLFKEVEME